MGVLVVSPIMKDSHQFRQDHKPVKRQSYQPWVKVLETSKRLLATGSTHRAVNFSILQVGHATKCGCSTAVHK